MLFLIITPQPALPIGCAKMDAIFITRIAIVEANNIRISTVDLDSERLNMRPNQVSRLEIICRSTVHMGWEPYARMAWMGSSATRSTWMAVPGICPSILGFVNITACIIGKSFLRITSPHPVFAKPVGHIGRPSSVVPRRKRRIQIRLSILGGVWRMHPWHRL